VIDPQGALIILWLVFCAGWIAYWAGGCLWRNIIRPWLEIWRSTEGFGRLVLVYLSLCIVVPVGLALLTFFGRHH
jgi:hypothetical protein